eukprot:8262897-Karenia_brevis.AAC.1
MGHPLAPPEGCWYFAMIICNFTEILTWTQNLYETIIVGNYVHKCQVVPSPSISEVLAVFCNENMYSHRRCCDTGPGS